MTRSFRFILLFLFLGFQSVAQEVLQKSIQQFVKDPALKHAGVGICVLDVSRNQVLAAHQSGLSLTPASSLKVLTTSSAMAILGAEFRFPTQLEISGSLQGKVLQGNVTIRGFGDPTLGSPNMRGTLPMDALLAKFRDALWNKGIRSVQGYLVGDGTYFPSDATTPGWAWADLGNYYASGAWGLNFHENQYFLNFQRSKTVGSTPRIALIQPDVPGLEFINEVKLAAPGTGDNAYIYGAPFTTLRYIRGTIPAGSGNFTIKGSLPDPPFFLAHHFQKTLERSGISSTKGAASQLDLQRRGLSKPGNAQILLKHFSPPLKEIIREAHYESNNLYCESLLRTLGRREKGSGMASTGVEVIQAYWAKRGLLFEGCFIEDGSGLSPRNAVTAQFFVNLLAKIGRDPKLFPTFSSTLALAGQTGNLQGKYKGSVAEGRLWAKSGSLERVRSYVGYAKNKKGQLRAFAILVNNYEGSGSEIREKMERLMLSFCED